MLSPVQFLLSSVCCLFFIFFFLQWPITSTRGKGLCYHFLLTTVSSAICLHFSEENVLPFYCSTFEKFFFPATTGSSHFFFRFKIFIYRKGEQDESGLSINKDHVEKGCCAHSFSVGRRGSEFTLYCQIETVEKSQGRDLLSRWQVWWHLWYNNLGCCIKGDGGRVRHQQVFVWCLGRVTATAIQRWKNSCYTCCCHAQGILCILIIFMSFKFIHIFSIIGTIWYHQTQSKLSRGVGSVYLHFKGFVRPAESRIHAIQIRLYNSRLLWQSRRRCQVYNAQDLGTDSGNHASSAHSPGAENVQIEIKTFA